MIVRRAPGPKGHWLLGSLADRRDRPLDFYTENRDTYGDVVRWRIGPLLIHQLNHPDHAKHVLVDHADRFTKGRQIPKLRPLLGKVLLTNEGAPWKKQRRLMQPAFHRDRLVRIAEGMIVDTQRLLDRWAPLAAKGEVVDVAAEMSALAWTFHLLAGHPEIDAKMRAGRSTAIRRSGRIRPASTPIVFSRSAPKGARATRICHSVAGSGSASGSTSR